MKKGKAQRLESLVSASPMSTIADEADRLFPAFRALPGEPKLRPPQEYLGRNPFSELKRRAEHASNLAALDKETQEKIKESQDLLAARKSANERLLHPTPTTTSANQNSTAANASSSSPLPPLRSVPPSTLADVALGTMSTSSLMSPVSSYWASFDAKRTSTTAPVDFSSHPWALSQGVVQVRPAVSEDEAQGSRSQLIKHKVEKHRGYFGQLLLEAKQVIDEDTLPVPLIVHFTQTVERLLVMHPSISSVEAFTNAPWSLDAFSVVDGVGLKMLFGKDVVPMLRVNGTLCRTPDACPKGNPASDPPSFLPGLHVSLNGKPGAGWPGDAATVVLHLSRYAYTCKSASVETSCKGFPNAFTRFGVDAGVLELASPFPLRFLDGATSFSPQDVSRLSLNYHAKRQTRVVEAAFALPLFQGYVESAAQLIVSGQLRRHDPPHGNADVEQQPHDDDGDELDDFDESLPHRKPAERANTPFLSTTVTVQLIMDIPDHVEQFSFRGAAAQLAFLDVIDSTKRRFAIVQQQQQQAQHQARSPLPRSVVVSGALHSRLDISLLWNIRRIPLLMRLFGGDQTIPMAGRLVREGPKRSVIRSAEPSTRFCVLWDFVKLKNIVAFVECEETVSIYGVDCVAEIEVANGTGGRATLSFEGRLCATIAESAQSLYSNTDAVHGALVRPADLVFEGTLADNAWNCVAGVPFVHLLQPTLRFVVNATTLLPLRIAVHGTPVVQSADPGVGLSSDHGLQWAPGSGVVEFPVDALPHYVLRVPISAPAPITVDTAAPTHHQQHLPTTLKDILVPLFHPDIVASFASGTCSSSSNNSSNVSTVLQAARRVAFKHAELIVNEDRAEIVIGAGGSTPTATVQRYPPGIWICADAAKVEMFGSQYSARGCFELKYQQTKANESDASLHGGAASVVSVQGTLSLLSRVQCADGLSIGASTAMGLGPDCAMSFRIGGGDHSAPSSSLSAVAASVEWALKDAVVAVAGLGALPCSALSLTIGPGHGIERVSQLSLAALFVPPMIQLEHADPVALATSIAPRKHSNRSIHDALKLFYSLNLSLRSFPGHSTNRRHRHDGHQRTQPQNVPILPAVIPSSLSHQTSHMVWDMHASNIAAPLCCGIQEAVLDTFIGKVAELRATCATTVLALRRQIEEAMRRHAFLQDELQSVREPIVAKSSDDVKSLQQALVAVTNECSNLAHRWTDAYHTCRIEEEAAAASQAASQHHASSDYAAYIVREHQRQAGTSRWRLQSARHHTVASGLSVLRQALQRATTEGIGASLSAYNGISSVGSSRGNGGDVAAASAGHCAVMQHLRLVEMGRLVQFVAVEQETVNALDVVLQHLQSDEVVFASLFRILAIEVHGGMRVGGTGGVGDPRSGGTQPVTSMNTFLCVSGICRQKPFRVLEPLSALDHPALIAAVDNATTELLRLYLSLLRFS